MASVTIAGGAAGNSGALAADNVFYVADGEVELSTDAGTTYIPFAPGDKIVVSTGNTVHWRNVRPSAAELRYMVL